MSRFHLTHCAKSLKNHELVLVFIKRVRPKVANVLGINLLSQEFGPFLASRTQLCN